jgi:beta-ribofuranosylaminobenzene 5'-phosphate synthase
MHDTGLRINGGIGFAIESPSITLNAKPSHSCVVNDNRKLGLSSEARNRLLNNLEVALSRYSLQKAVMIDISGEADANHGFGTGTAIRLASLEALMCINGNELSNKELIHLSGRGGTSGIGVNTFFSGGAVIDLGIRKPNSTQRPHRPSSVVRSIISPLVLQRYDMPKWNIGICIPTNIESLTKEQEENFFNEICPIKESEAYKSLYHSVTGVMASICEKDKQAFEYSIRELQKCEWKMAERKCHGDALLEIEDILYDIGASAVGMSSLGPSLYFLADDIDKVIAQAKIDLPSCVFLRTQPCNYGRKIQCLS